MLTWTAPTIGALLLIVALVCTKKKKLPRGKNWMFLGAGLGLSGLLGNLIGWFTGMFERVGGAVTQVLFGVAAPALLTIGIVVALAIDLHPKKGKPGKLTPWLALLAFPLLTVTLAGLGLREPVNQFLVAAGQQLGAIVGSVTASL